MASPLRAADLAPYVRGRAISAAAIRVAVTDVDCKARTGLVKTWFDVESGIQRQQVEDNQLTLRDIQGRITAVVKAAAAVTG
ncbi:hypothetical protein [Actinacidiphila sp. ITFR-21]|uniref:hypothetical protein n=1 Tax=Actinacidiphila sp. ITFR-21 TaxID=3075199 RepID=UPI002889D6D2|nr:hypothetical protein [Streptomyces sp. ITFR-21]WNI16186.1 hypothetical protein RLT57_12015 [Streptomyces sp. ITFR-21]